MGAGGVAVPAADPAGAADATTDAAGAAPAVTVAAAEVAGGAAVGGISGHGMPGLQIGGRMRAWYWWYSAGLKGAVAYGMTPGRPGRGRGRCGKMGLGTAPAGAAARGCGGDTGAADDTGTGIGLVGRWLGCAAPAAGGGRTGVVAGGRPGVREHMSLRTRCEGLAEAGAVAAVIAVQTNIYASKHVKRIRIRAAVSLIGRGQNLTAGITNKRKPPGRPQWTTARSSQGLRRW